VFVTSIPRSRRAHKRALLLGAVLATGAISAPRPAAARAAVVQAGAAITATPAAVNRGGLVIVSGAGFAAREPIRLYFVAAPKVVTRATTAANGLLPATGVTVPYSIAPGARHLVALGERSKRQAVALVTVRAIAPRLTLSPAVVKPGQTETVSGRGFGARERVTLALNGAALVTNPAVVETANGAFTASFVAPSRLLAGANTISAVGNGSRVTAVAALRGVLPVAARFYFAGGLTTATEHAFVALLNPHAQTATARLTFYFENGQTAVRDIPLAAHAQKVVSVADLQGPSGTFGLYVRANRSVTAQITTARDGRDGDALLGNSGLGATWYLAEGYTGLTFHETVSILNPDPAAPATVQLRLLPLGGGPAKVAPVTVAAHTNGVVDINSLLPGQSVSIVATSDRPVVVERTLTFGPGGYGMTSRAGTETTATSWLFAEGTTVNRFQTYLTILDPGAAPATVTASFYAGDGASLGSRTLVVPAASRANLRLNDSLSVSGIASVVTSDQPVVVERPEYFGSPNAAGIAGSDVFGQNGAGVRASFAGGDTGTSSEFLLIYNPSAATIPIDATFYGADGARTTKRIDVAPTARYTMNVNTAIPGFSPSHGVALASLNGLGFVAEQTVFAPNHTTLRSTQGLAQ
jgi:hypothetical protein